MAEIGLTAVGDPWSACRRPRDLSGAPGVTRRRSRITTETTTELMKQRTEHRTAMAMAMPRSARASWSAVAKPYAAKVFATAIGSGCTVNHPLRPPREASM